MASESLEAQIHRYQHKLRPRDELAEAPNGRPLTNVCDWLHDTVVTNRKEKRRALAEAKRFGCYEVKVPDVERQTKTTWEHAAECPKYDWKKHFGEKAAAPKAEESAIDKATVPWTPTDTPIAEALAIALARTGSE